MMRTRTQIAVAGLGLALVAGTAGAQQALRLRAGEHPGFTRLVLDAPAGAAFSWGIEGRTLTLLLPGLGGTIDTDPARQTPNLSRVSVAQGITSARGVGLRVALTCDCGARTTRLADGRIVLDIAASAPRPTPPALAMPPAPGIDIATVPAEADAAVSAAAPPDAPPVAPAPSLAQPRALPASRPQAPRVAATPAPPRLARASTDIAARAATAPQRTAPARPPAVGEPAQAAVTAPRHATPDAPAPTAGNAATPPAPTPATPPAPTAATPPAPIPPAPVNPTTIEAARDRLLAQLTKAADEGLLTLVDPPATAPDIHRGPDPAPGQAAPADAPATAPDPAQAQAQAQAPAGAPERAAAPAPAPDRAAAPAPAPDRAATPAPAPEPAGTPRDAADLLAPHLRVRTAIDIAQADRTAHQPPVEAPAETCIADSDLDVASWATDAPFAAQLGDRRRALIGEFDAPDPKAVTDYAHLMLHFGLGLEARDVLETFGATLAPPSVLVDMAAVVDGDASAPSGALRAGLGCPGYHGLWAAAASALDGGLDGATVDPDALRLPLTTTPPRLRARLAVPIATAALEAGRLTEAEILAGIAARAEPPAPDGDAMLTVLLARIDAARGEWRRAEASLGDLAGETSPAGVEAMIRLVEMRLARGLSTPPGLAGNMEAVAYSQGATPLGRRLLGAAAQARASGEGLAPALAALAALAERAGDPSAAQAAARQILIDFEPEPERSAAYAETVLKYWSLVGDDAGGDPARIAVARRLVTFGLDNLAEELLAPALGRGDAAARLTAASAAMTSDPARALSHLVDLSGDGVARLRAEVLSELGRHADAAAEAVKAGDAALAARYAWLAGNWAAAAVAGDLDRRILAAWMSGATEMPQELRDAAAADPSQAALVEAFPTPAPATEPTPLEAAQAALEASKRRRAIMGGLLGDG